MYSKKMISKFYPVLFLFLLLFSGCGKSSSKTEISSKNTLRQTAESRYKQTAWMEMLEKDRLTSPVNFINKVEKSITASPLVYLTSEYRREAPEVYPYLDGFGYLNTKKIKPEIKKIVLDFSENLCAGIPNDSFVSAENIYELSFFMYDLKKKWKDAFDCDFPVKPEKKESAEQDGQSKSNTNSTNSTNEEKNSRFIFTDYILGEPMEMNGQQEVPVRYYIEKNNGFADVLLYFTTDSENSWKIDQLKITKMEATNVSDSE